MEGVDTLAVDSLDGETTTLDQGESKTVAVTATDGGATAAEGATVEVTPSTVSVLRSRTDAPRSHRRCSAASRSSTAKSRWMARSSWDAQGSLEQEVRAVRPLDDDRLGGRREVAPVAAAEETRGDTDGETGALFDGHGILVAVAVVGWVLVYRGRR